MERLCGCGSGFKCLKTGLTIADKDYGSGEGAYRSADLHGCRSCGSTLLVVTEVYIRHDDIQVDVILKDGKAFYTDSFKLELVRINGDITQWGL